MIRTLAAAATTMMLVSGQAGAHSEAAGSTPQDGAVLSEAPEEIVIRFDGALRLVRATLTGPEGAEARLEVPGAEVEEWSPEVDALDAGTWTIDWRGLSTDGHPVTDSLSFEIEG